MDQQHKTFKEAYHYTSKDGATQCNLCPHQCLLQDGKIGICRTRVNEGGKLYTLAYGNPCAAHIDPIEKKPLYHFYPASQIFSISTAGCNLRCLNCQNWSLSQVSPRETRNYELMPEEVVDFCLKKDCKSIAYTYGEPIVYYEYTIDTAKIAKEKGIKNVMVSAGYINEKPLRELCQYIDAANIDLKGFDATTYEKLNSAKLHPVLNTLKVLAEEGVWLEITNLVVPTYSDDLDEITRMCNWLVENNLENYPLHFSRFSPMHKLDDLPSTPVETLKKAHAIALEAGIKYVYIGNVPRKQCREYNMPIL